MATSEFEKYSSSNGHLRNGSKSEWVLIDPHAFLKIILGAFLSLYWCNSWRIGKGGEREKRQQMAGGGIEPGDSAMMTHLLYMGCPLYQLSYRGNPRSPLYSINVYHTKNGFGLYSLFPNLKQLAERVIASYSLKWRKEKPSNTHSTQTHNSQLTVLTLSTHSTNWAGTHQPPHIISDCCQLRENSTGAANNSWWAEWVKPVTQ